MRWLVVPFALACAGCGLQLGTGPSRNVTGATRQTVSLGTSMAVDRRSNGIVGARVVTVANDGLDLRALVVHGGWDVAVAPGWLILEGGVDLGAGSSVTRTFGGVGAYGGLSGNFRVRPFPNAARSPSFTIASLVPEVVFAPRAGWWMPPERPPSNGAMDFEMGWEGALRLTFGSDFSSGPQGQPATDRRVPEGVQ